MRHWLYRDVRKFYYLDGDVIVIRQNGTVHAYQSFKDNLGSILSVIDENGSKVFSAEYDAWGKQTISVNTIGLIRGYGSHEMLNEFNLINMNGRVYDPVLGRFLSPDKYVQEGNAIKMRYPDQPVYVHFYSPRWICRVGNFRSLEEARKMLAKVKAMGYRQACLVKGKITVQY